jgi:hypothetical protein
LREIKNFEGLPVPAQPDPSKNKNTDSKTNSDPGIVWQYKTLQRILDQIF